MNKASMPRRRFLRWGGTGLVASALAGACRTSAAAAPIDAAPRQLPTAGEVASRPASAALIEGICQQTAQSIEGPFFKADAPFRAVLIPKNAPVRTHLRLEGQVMSSECTPLAGAIVEVWQANLDGDYDLRGHHMRARLRTDEKGHYQIDTIEPGRYLNGPQYRPAHIHVKVHALDHRSLTTQLYFAGDPYNEVDPWFVPELLIQSREREGGGRHGRFDFYLGA